MGLSGKFGRAALVGIAAAGVVALSTLPNTAQDDRCGDASWYSLPGYKTANGETMNPNALTAAHRSLPFDTLVRVRNLANGRTLDLRINDRGPYVGTRLIDVSKTAANKLGFVEDGVVEVCFTEI